MRGIIKEIDLPVPTVFNPFSDLTCFLSDHAIIASVLAPKALTYCLFRLTITLYRRFPVTVKTLEKLALYDCPWRIL